MARAKTIDELLQEAEKGQSGSTLGEQERKQRERVPETEKEQKAREEHEKKRKGRRGFLSGRRDKRTILDIAKIMAEREEEEAS